MEASYGCCKNKPLTGLCCVVCHEIFHPSCLQRRKDAVKIGFHKIYCSSNCQEKLLSEEERQSDFDKVIQGLREEIKGRDQYIERLRKQSRDFEDEVCNTEQGYIVKLRELGDTALRREAKLEELRIAIAGLQEELNALKDLNKKLNIDLGDMNTINRDMVETIRTLEAECETYGREAKLLQFELSQLKQQSHNTKASKCLLMSGPTPKLTRPKENRPRLLLVSGAFGRGLVDLLGKQSGGSYSMQAILKPNSTNSELISTAVENSKNFTKRDIVIVWPFTLTSKLIDDFVLTSNHTNVLMMTRPFGREAGENFHIYESGLALCKHLHSRGLSLACVFDCNSIHCNQERTSYYTRQGRWRLSRALWRHIENRLLSITTERNAGLRTDELSAETADPKVTPNCEGAQQTVSINNLDNVVAAAQGPQGPASLAESSIQSSMGFLG